MGWLPPVKVFPERHTNRALKPCALAFGLRLILAPAIGVGVNDGVNVGARGRKTNGASIFPVRPQFTTEGKGGSREKLSLKYSPVVIRNEQVAGSNPAGGSLRAAGPPAQVGGLVNLAQGKLGGKYFVLRGCSESFPPVRVHRFLPVAFPPVPFTLPPQRMGEQ